MASDVTDQPLMPPDGYPAELTAEGRIAADELLRPLQPLIPTEPGEFLDKTGDRWTLDRHGRWTDHHGERRPASHTPLLGVSAPFVGPLRG